jgi:hypothetical protein
MWSQQIFVADVINPSSGIGGVGHYVPHKREMKADCTFFRDEEFIDKTSIGMDSAAA